MKVQGCILREREGDRVYPRSTLEYLVRVLNNSEPDIWVFDTRTHTETKVRAWLLDELDLLGESRVMIEFDSPKSSGSKDFLFEDGFEDILETHKITVEYKRS